MSRGVLRMTANELAQFLERGRKLQTGAATLAPIPPSHNASRLWQQRANQDAHGRLLTAIMIAFSKRHPAVAWIVRMNTGQFRSMDGERIVRCGWKGQPDIVGQLATGHFLAIEGKTGDGSPSADQAQGVNTINAAGGLALVARSTQDVSNALQAWQLGQWKPDPLPIPRGRRRKEKM